jgi:hypothetical protein
MGAEFTIQEETLGVLCTGECTRGEILAWIDRIAEMKRAHPPIEQCLIDCREARFQIDIFGRFQIGEYAALKLAGLRVRVALLAREEMITRVIENTAYNRGLRMFTTHDEDAARAWLADRAHLPEPQPRGCK